MKKTIFLCLIMSFCSISLFSEPFYNINKENETEVKTIISQFNQEPFNEFNQEEILRLMTIVPEYRDSSYLLSLIKDVILFTENPAIKNQSLFLLANDNFPEEVKVFDRTTKKEKIKKINTRLLKAKFTKVKASLNKGFKHIVYLDTIDEKETAEALYNDIFELSQKRVLTETDTLFKIKYMIKKGQLESANLVFNAYINKVFEKKFEIGDTKKIKVEDEDRFIFGDIYSYGAFLNYKNKELFEKFKERSHFFYKEITHRFDYILAVELNKQELYEDSSYFYENLRARDNSILFTNNLLETYYKATRKDLLNNKFDSAWLNARKGLLLSEDVISVESNKIKYTPILLELKKMLKISSLSYIKELVEKSEHAHASRIKKETLDLISKRLI